MLDDDPGIQMFSHLPGTPVDDVPVGSAVEVLFSIVILVGGKCMRIGKSVGLSVLTHSWSASSAIAER